MNKSPETNLTRREVVQMSFAALGTALMLAGGSKALAAAWAAAENADRNASKAFFSAQEMALLGEVVEIIIPTTDTPGAREANVHSFLDQLMAEWALPETQAELRALLGDVDAGARERYGARFLDLNPEAQFERISSMDADAFGQSESTPGHAHPFARFKALVLLGYYHSEIGATRELQFRLVPGHYEPCVALEDIGRASIGDVWEFFAYQRILSV
jgi:hypothetical protein